MYLLQFFVVLFVYYVYTQVYKNKLPKILMGITENIKFQKFISRNKSELHMNFSG